MDAKMESQAANNKSRKQRKNMKGREKFRAKKGEIGLQERSQHKLMIQDLKRRVETIQVTFVRKDGRLAALEGKMKAKEMAELQKIQEIEKLNAQIRQIDFELAQHSKLHEIQDRSILELRRHADNTST